MNDFIVLCVGGDARYVYMCEQLAKKYTVAAYRTTAAPRGAAVLSELSELKEKADMLVLPMLKNVIYENEKAYISCGKDSICIDDLLTCIKDDAIITGGTVDDRTASYFEEHGFDITDYFKRKELIIKNCIPTAEGALMIALQEQITTVFGSKVLVTGFGNVAKATARLFSAVGANVECVVRRKEAAAEAFEANIKAYGFDNIAEHIDKFDIVINTVPALVINEKLIEKMNKKALIIDLASMPGGVDKEAAKANGIRCIHALALPGKTAPVTAGRFLAETVENIISEGRE